LSPTDYNLAAADVFGGAHVHDVGRALHRTEVQQMCDLIGAAVFAGQHLADRARSWVICGLSKVRPTIWRISAILGGQLPFIDQPVGRVAVEGNAPQVMECSPS
jgi:hypothetical protein